MTVVDLMNLEDQVDLDFTLARRRARLGRLKTLLLKRATRSTLLSPEEFRRNVPPTAATIILDPIASRRHKGLLVEAL
jgi:hypothetical protein